MTPHAYQKEQHGDTTTGRTYNNQLIITNLQQNYITRTPREHEQHGEDSNNHHQPNPPPEMAPKTTQMTTKVQSNYNTYQLTVTTYLITYQP
jgi:hypothetical protein